MTALYDRIGRDYDVTRQADPEIVRRLRVHLQLRDGRPVLDVGCGTGNYTIALAETGLMMTGADVSREMIRQAERKSDRVKWVQADAEALPFPDGTFDGATMVLCAHHMQKIGKVFSEVCRVLRSGRLVIFTSSPEQMERYWLREYFPRALEAACRQMPPVSLLTARLKEAGFVRCEAETFLVQPDLQDLFLYSGKHRPHLYLDPAVRAGISTFVTLAEEEEIRTGCERLRADIKSGRIDRVREQYAGNRGDYLFIVAEKG
ncbi:MAG: class I SAM-dependent methyltransferase [Planifilum fimeticola]